MVNNLCDDDITVKDKKEGILFGKRIVERLYPNFVLGNEYVATGQIGESLDKTHGRMIYSVTDINQTRMITINIVKDHEEMLATCVCCQNEDENEKTSQYCMVIHNNQFHLAYSLEMITGKPEDEWEIKWLA